ncbi:MAG: hypothetical protein H7A53_02440 [Akkermansiaceae bacterium]|nr:hypothetical protein [Akkermansiaceae bacterium]MCP5549743.1 hypothetical protein [Akkermansiaceae bacterium]
MIAPPLLLVFGLLALLDAGAVFVAVKGIGTSAVPPVAGALAIHAAVAVIAALAMRMFPGARERRGYTTLGILAALLCFLTPVLGCLAAMWLDAAIGRPLAAPEKPGPFLFGNPLARSSAGPAPVPVSEPLAESVSNGFFGAHRLAVPILMSEGGRGSVSLLRRLRELPDARTQLFAQGALAALTEKNDRRVESLRERVRSGAAGAADRERLGWALHGAAEAGLLPGEETAAALEEAASQFGRAVEMAPENPACLFGMALCLIGLDRMEEIPDLYGRLCALRGAGGYADRLEVAFFAASGNWRRTAAAVGRLAEAGNESGLPAAVRHFWLGAPAAAR